MSNEALRLAASYEATGLSGHIHLANVLRSLVAENDKLRAELKTAHMDGYEGGKQEARDAAHEEIDKLRAAARLGLEALGGVLDRAPGLATQFWSVSGGVYEAVECNAAITALREALGEK